MTSHLYICLHLSEFYEKNKIPVDDFSFLLLNKKRILSPNSGTFSSYGPFAIKREETARKKIFELMPILDIFQPKNHIWHINVTLIFFGSFPPFYCKGPISVIIINIILDNNCLKIYCISTYIGNYKTLITMDSFLFIIDIN